jgi:hypothetical protein
MTLRYMIFCDYSIEGRDGKLTAVGITDTIYAHNFPATHRSGHLIASFEMTPEDQGRTRGIELRFINEDGVVLMNAAAEVVCPNELVILNHRHILMDMPIEREGDFEFHMLVDGVVAATASLRARKVPD